MFEGDTGIGDILHNLWKGGSGGPSIWISQNIYSRDLSMSPNHHHSSIHQPGDRVLIIISSVIPVNLPSSFKRTLSSDSDA